MAYATRNFRTKKELTLAVKDGTGDLSCYENTPAGPVPITNGTTYLEGPHYPEPHRWYAQATVKDGKIVKVK